MSDNNLTRSCVHCQQAFTPRKTDQKYCTRQCFLDWEVAHYHPRRNIIHCRNCGATVRCPPSHAGKKFYCSRRCLGEWRAANTDIIKQARIASLADRTCKLCGSVFKPTSARQSWCPLCVPDKSARARFQRYGIAQPQVDAMYLSQGGGCAVCSSPEPRNVDHDHSTGKVRGLLCDRCNMGLAFVEDTEWARKARKYLHRQKK